MPSFFAQFTDAHAHLPLTPERDVEVRVSEHTKILLNSTRVEDFERVAALANKFPKNIVPAFGIHPWFAEEWTNKTEKTLRKFLSGTPNAVVGEIGLDACRGDASLQKTAFVAQLAIAAEFCVPTSIHCVRSFGKTEMILRDFHIEKMLTPFLLHAYSGSAEQAKIFAKFGGVFSSPKNQLSSECLIVPESDQTIA